MGGGPAGVPFGIEQDLCPALVEVFLCGCIILLDDERELDAEIPLEPVGELLHRALQIALFVDVGEGSFARDDDG